MKNKVLILVLFIYNICYSQTWDVKNYILCDEIGDTVEYKTLDKTVLDINSNIITLGSSTFYVTDKEEYTRLNGDVIISYFGVDNDGQDVQLTYSRFSDIEEFIVHYYDYYISYFIKKAL